MNRRTMRSRRGNESQGINAPSTAPFIVARRQEPLHHTTLSQAYLKAELLGGVGLEQLQGRDLRPIRRPRHLHRNHQGVMGGTMQAQ